MLPVLQPSQAIPLSLVFLSPYIHSRGLLNNVPLPVPLGFTPDDAVPGPAEPIIPDAPGMPFGLAFMGTAWSEFELIKYAFAYEQATHTRLRRKAFQEAIPKTQLIDVMV